MISPADARFTVGDVGKLTVTVFDEEGQVIPGPPSWAPPDWQVSDPAKIDFATDGSFTALDNGEVRIGAGLAGLRGTGVLISPSRVELSAPVVYVNQAIQNLEGSVPLIAGRDALLRVFVTGDQVSYYEPRAYGLPARRYVMRCDGARQAREAERGTMGWCLWARAAPAVLPTGGGPYRLEGFGTGGRVHFSFDFTPTPLEYGGGPVLMRTNSHVRLVMFGASNNTRAVATFFTLRFPV